jgi:hypothetical protein
MQKLEQRCQRHPAQGGEHSPNGAPIHGPLADGSYETPDNVKVKKIKDRWLYFTTLPGVFAGKMHNVSDRDFAGQVYAFFDNDGNPLPKVGNLADGCAVYRSPENPEKFFSSRARILFDGPDSYPIAPPDVSRKIDHESVILVHGRFVYGVHGYYYIPQQGGPHLLFDGRQWINERTGKIYNTEQDIPREYKRSYW